jgi:hypothetical protein
VKASDSSMPCCHRGSNPCDRKTFVAAGVSRNVSSAL